MWGAALGRCRWLTRGWTLQELLAPRNVQFFDSNWGFLFTKSQCIREISAITGIADSILEQQVPLSDVPVCQRLSWASSRHTTRIEDEAYCLMGIFEVNMPLLYGEEHKAFMRLQEEIITATQDLTILAWTYPDPYGSYPAQRAAVSGFLAESPRWFWRSMHYKAANRQRVMHFSMSKRMARLSATIFVQHSRSDEGYNREDLFLPICSSDNETEHVVHIRRFDEDGSFVRQNPHVLPSLRTWPEGFARESPLLLHALSVRNNEIVRCMSWIGICRLHLCQVRVPQEIEVAASPWPDSSWDGESGAFFANYNYFMPSGAPAYMQFKVTTLTVDLSLFIMGWDAPGTDELRFTLVDLGKYMDRHQQDKFLRNVQDLSNRNSYFLRRQLMVAGIPLQNMLVCPLADPDKYVLFSVTAQLVKDALICHNPFWRFNISYDARRY